MKKFFFGVIFGCFITTHWETIESIPSEVYDWCAQLVKVQWCMSAVGNRDEICDE